MPLGTQGLERWANQGSMAPGDFQGLGGLKGEVKPPGERATQAAPSILGLGC